MTVLPTATQADHADQETFVFDADRESGLDVAAVRAGESAHGLAAADLSDRIDQAWSVSCVDDDLSCLAY